MSLRAVRSPDAPKMTRHAGSGVRASRSPSLSGFWSVTVIAGRSSQRARVTRRVPEPRQDPRPPQRRRTVMGGSLLDRVAPELIAQRGRDLHRVRVILARGEAREQRVCEHRCRDVMRDRLLNGPAPFARVRDPALYVREVGALLLERALRELEQPRAHDAALQPDARDALHVDAEVARVDQLEAFAVGLHHPVLDPVVDHLDEVAGAALAEMRPAARWCERIEDRLHDRDGALTAADHHAVAELQSPDAAGHADVEKIEPERRVLLRAADRIAEVRVRAIDQDVALARVPRELIKCVIGRLAGGDHRPEDARWPQLLDHLRDRVGASGALGLRLIDRARAAIARDDAMPAADQPRDHVAAHPAQAVEPDLHAVTPVLSPRIFGPRRLPAVPLGSGDRDRD